MRVLSVFVFLFFIFHSVKAQQIAFPTAEGMGKYTTGGRGTPTVPTTVMEVTNLNDDNLPGSLRYAATKSGITHRTIVFRVSGTIRLTSRLVLNRPNTTIAGQTAPGDGICIADYPVSISADNLIIRYLRFRLGDKNQNLGMVNGSGDGDALSGTGHKNIIIDHCTMSWSNDEAFTVYDGDSTTLQWNILSEPLNYSYHFESGDSDFERHGYGGIWGGKHTTAHHNLIAHVKGRAPRFCGSRFMGDGATPGLENVDFRNNVIYNWQDYNVNGGEGGNYNVVNNYYKFGPSTSTTAARKFMIINPGKSSTLPYGKYYLTGNYVEGSTANTNSNWLGALMDGASGATNIAAAKAAATATVAFPWLAIPDESAADAYTRVLKNAGCVLPNRDTLDARIVNDVINGTGKIIDVQGGYPAHSTNTPAGFAATLNAWPTLASAPAPTDSDKDGMPDEWEQQRGLNSNNATDRNGYHSNGYTNIENWLNGDTIVAYGKINNCVTARKINASATGLWLHAKDTTYTRLISTDTNNLVASIFDNAALGEFNVSYYTTGTVRNYASIRPYLNRNITITAASPISTPVNVRIYFTEAEFNALKAADLSIITVADLNVLKVANNNCPTALTAVPEVIAPSAYGTYGTYQKGYYLEFTTSSFSTFFIGGKIYFPVPVKLVSFNAVQNNGVVKTNWSTNNEINAQKFIVERSNDDLSFTEIGTVVAGNLATLNNYNFTDLDPINGINYYRLKMIDRDAAFTYSKTIAVNYKKEISSFAVNPNPVKNILKLSFPQSNSAGVLTIFGSDGRKLLIEKIKANSTGQLLDVAFLNKGIYSAVLVSDNKVQTIRFIKN
ncbi:T9SS type A sorting domain-containing protein [Ferruginibacter sp. SUN002]|uniref:T9SS type A sorting domain-containing protein n=1 Tax=Ferruginibacter sp. SUN002 TaxID=2937789 RepID=UPI003D36D65A